MTGTKGFRNPKNWTKHEILSKTKNVKTKIKGFFEIINHTTLVNTPMS